MGQAGGSYGFRLRAVDTNNQPEPWPADDAFETSVTLPFTCNPDNLEPNDDFTQASLLPLGVGAQSNLCPAGDPDWFRVDIGTAADYFVTAPSQSGGAAVSITVYAEDGVTILANGQATGVGQRAMVRFQAAVPGSYFVKIDPLVPDLMGTEAIYGIRVSEAKGVFLPLVTR